MTSPALSDARLREIQERAAALCPKCNGTKIELRRGYADGGDVVSSCRLCKGTGNQAIDPDIPDLLAALAAAQAENARWKKAFDDSKLRSEHEFSLKQAEIARLRADIDTRRPDITTWQGKCGHQWRKDQIDQCPICDNARLREALEPFKNEFDRLEQLVPLHGARVVIVVAESDLRRAAAASNQGDGTNECR